MDALLRPRAVLVLLIALLLTALAPVASQASDADVADTSDALSSLRAADENFQDYAANRDRIRFQTLLDRDAVYLGEELHRGFGAVLHAWNPLWNEKYGLSYRGEVLDVIVAESGNLGMTLGRAETRFQTPVDEEEQVQAGHYVTVWTKGPDGWKMVASGPLSVHPDLGPSRDPRGALMAAWPELADRIDSELEIRWKPESTVRAASGELAWVFGAYEARFGSDEDSPVNETAPGNAGGGSGYFLAIWQKNGEDHWQLIAESMTPPAASR